MDQVKIDQWVAFFKVVVTEVAKLTPNKFDDVLPQVIDGIWMVLRPTFASNGHVIEVEEDVADLIVKLAAQAPSVD